MLLISDKPNRGPALAKLHYEATKIEYSKLFAPKVELMYKSGPCVGIQKISLNCNRVLLCKSLNNPKDYDAITRIISSLETTRSM